jgi:putative membrane protein
MSRQAEAGKGMKRCTRLLWLSALAGFCMPTTTRAAVSGGDRAFLVEVMQINVNEIELSTLAAKRAANPELKTFAEKMITDHKMLQKKLRPFAMAWSVPAPTHLDAAHHDAYRALKKLRGQAFDKQYIAVIDKDHNNMLEAFTHEANVASDPDFKATVISEKSVIAAHTNMADDLKSKL